MEHKISKTYWSLLVISILKVKRLLSLRIKYQVITARYITVGGCTLLESLTDGHFLIQSLLHPCIKEYYVGLYFGREK